MTLSTRHTLIPTLIVAHSAVHVARTPPTAANIKKSFRGQLSRSARRQETYV